MTTADVKPMRRLLYTTHGAAEQLSISERQVRILITDGELDVVRIGRRRLVSHDALADYVERLKRAL